MCRIPEQDKLPGMVRSLARFTAESTCVEAAADALQQGLATLTLKDALPAQSSLVEHLRVPAFALRVAAANGDMDHLQDLLQGLSRHASGQKSSTSIILVILKLAIMLSSTSLHVSIISPVMLFVPMCVCLQ